MNALLLFLLGFQCSSVFGVVSPLDKVTEELKVMQETVNSVQASLITSVSLIQGKRNKNRDSGNYPLVKIRM